MQLVCTIASSLDPILFQSTGECASSWFRENVASILIAAVGAFAGAYGAQVIAEHEASRRRKLEELRATNTAFALALFVFNVATSTGRQLIRPLVDTYEKELAKVEAVVAQGCGSVEFTADFGSIPLPELPLERLADTIFQLINAPLRLTTVASMAISAVGQLRSTIELRNDFCDGTRKNPPPEGHPRRELYFGIPSEAGHIDERYKGMVAALSSYNSDVALFFALLLEELNAHGRASAASLGRGAPKAADADLSSAFSAGLIPSLASYHDLLKNMGFDPDNVLSRHRA